MNHKFSLFCAVSLILIVTTSCSALDSVGLSAATETATPLPTNTATPVLATTATPTSTPTLVPSPTPTAVGGGAGKIVFGAYFGDRSLGRFNICLHDFSEYKSQIILEDYRLHDISPDGKQLLVSKDKILYIADLDGSIRVEVTEQFNNVAGFLSYGKGDDDIVMFTKEENGIVQAFIKHSDGQVEQVSDSTVGVMDFKLPLFGKSLIWEEGYSTRTASYAYGWRLTNLETKETKELSYTEPMISSDGQHLAIAAENNISPLSLLMVTNPEGETVVELQAADFVDNPSPGSSYFFESYRWKPDNNSLFTSIYDYNNKPVAKVLINLDGEVLQDNLDLSPVAWSPDGRRYVGYKLVDEGSRNRQVLHLSIEFSQGEMMIIDNSFDEEIWYFVSVFWLP